MFKNLKYKIFFIFILNLIIFFTIFTIIKKKENTSVKLNLIANTHNQLPWKFVTKSSPLKLKIGELTNIEYQVTNLSNKTTSGIATFAVYPNELKEFIIKMDCFCYDKQVLNALESKKFILSVMIDPKVTKDSKTKSIDEGILQFIFFDSANFKN